MMNRAKLGMLLLAVLAAAARTIQAEEPAALFTPSVSWERQGDHVALVTVAFAVAENAYVYEDQLRLKAPPGVEVTPAGGDEPVVKEGEESRVFLKDFTRHYRLQGGLPVPLLIEVTFQGCSDGVCMLPETARFALGPAPEGQLLGADEAAAPPGADVASPAAWQALAKRFQEGGRATGYMDKGAFLAWADQAEQGVAPDEDILRRVFTRYGLLLAALLVIPLGLLLNLTPCVLPMIPINLAIIGAGAKAGGKGRGFRQGGVYGLGMALTYGALGLLAVLTGGRFGALNSSPWFNLAVAVVFVVLALAMFDVLIIDLSRWRRVGGGGDGGAMGLTGVFVLGAVAAVLGGACVAPVLIWVLLLAADLWSRGNAVGLVLPFLLGVGMALPWPLLGAGMAKMPRPGAWMEQVKRVFGVLILLAAAYYAWLAFSLFRPTAGAADSAALDGWHTDLPAAMQLAERTGQPLFLDFWGITCKSCMAMKATTFQEPDVIERMQPWIKVAVQADDAADPQLAAVLRYYEVVGLPTYILLRDAAAAPPVGK